MLQILQAENGEPLTPLGPKKDVALISTYMVPHSESQMQKKKREKKKEE